jgi:tRNA A37 threonylcarbamoyladenosine biosynthesis protein TsaE
VEWAERLPDDLRDGSTMLRFEVEDDGRRVELTTAEERLEAAATNAAEDVEIA